MYSRFALALLAACGFAISQSGCHHHLSYQDRVWNGWCGQGDCGTGCKDGKCGASNKLFAGGGPLKKFNNYTFCANGCGEAYVGEWISDPPDCCDPCDKYYGCFTGADECCHKKTFDPLLRILRWKHLHCRPWYANHVPSSGCHYVECPHVYGCHPVVCVHCSGKGCGKCCEKGCGHGGVIGDYVPAEMEVPEAPTIEQQDGFPIPTPTLAGASGNRVASFAEAEDE